METATIELERPEARARELTALEADAVPEGGYGWVVVGACAVLAWWSVGTNYCWGVIQNAFVTRGLSSASTLSFVGSVAAAMVSILAIINSRLVRTIGARYTALLGVSLLGTGEILSGFSTNNVGALFFTAGFVIGLGVSLCFMVLSITPAQYFGKKRGLANGIVFAGGGLGGAVISFGTESLIRRFGPEWAYRVLGISTLVTGLPAAWLIKERVVIRSGTFIEWRLFRDFRFVVLWVAGSVATFPLLVPPFFVPMYSNAIGLSPSTGAALVAGFNFSSAVGRIGCGLLSDVLGPLNTLYLALMLSAISMLALWPVTTTLAPMVVFVIINGAANGGFFSSITTVVGNVFGSARVAIAMGMIITGWAGGYLMGSPIAGYLLEAYGGEKAGFQAYRPAIFYAGSMALGATGLVAIVRLRINANIFGKL